MTYDQQILDAVASADRPLSHSDIAGRIAPFDNRAWGRIGNALTKLYRSGLLSREKIGHHFHYKPPDGTASPPTYADLVARLAAALAVCEALLRWYHDPHALAVTDVVAMAEDAIEKARP